MIGQIPETTLVVEPEQMLIGMYVEMGLAGKDIDDSLWKSQGFRVSCDVFFINQNQTYAPKCASETMCWETSFPLFSSFLIK